MRQAASWWCTVVALALACAGCGSEPRGTTATTSARAPAIVPAPPPRSPEVTSVDLKLPNRAGSIKFAVIGDSGRGSREQYDVAEQMIAFRRAFDYGFVLMLGDNVYDGGTPEDYRLKFELPYKPLLGEGVDFYAVIGNHDDPNQPWYAPFHMEGRRYYTFKKETLGGIVGPSVRFFMLDTDLPDAAQLAWLRREAAATGADWKIAVFHRPIYTSGRYARQAALLRRLIEPALIDAGISVAFSGHEHFYERTTPQNGITYFISGAAGSLRAGDIGRSGFTAAGFDTDLHFMLVEVAGDELFFQAIRRNGATVDVGSVPRRR